MRFNSIFNGSGRPVGRRLAAFGVVAAVGLGLMVSGWISPPALWAGASSGPVVWTRSGPVQGVINGTVREFLGIPYAAAPSGPLRWRPPQAPQPWSVVRDASRPGPACPQSPNFFGPASCNEDCLSLNIYAPQTSKQLLPVFVWIHGGDFITGQGADYDGVDLALAGNLIVVTINYRLGIFGFFAHPALDREATDNSSGNYGLMDQQLALRWVQDNIQAFGGDPRNVTVAGESAGGLSILTHLASPTAAGLFQRAIVESGSFRLAWPSQNDADLAGAKLAKSMGCTLAAAGCLRKLTVAQLLAAQDTATGTSIQSLLMWGPHLGGDILPKQPLLAIRDGSFNRVPVMIGTNHDEGRMFIAYSYDLAGGPITADAYPEVIKNVYGPIAKPMVLGVYPASAYANPDLAFATLFGDSGLSCMGYIIEFALSKQVDTYVYEFRDENAPQVYLPPISSFSYGATHGSELPYIFPQVQGYEYDLGTAVLDAGQQQLADMMKSYWAQFARSGNPNRAGMPVWSSYIAGNDSVMSLVPPVPAMASGFVSDHKCLFWAPLLELSAVLPPWLTGAVE
ncbi:MAG: carboxylesterase family protein [Desulfobacteraceae bacterium]|nr:carboxylesterase family protein [Desulfobacteraceae bacterium]